LIGAATSRVTRVALVDDLCALANSLPADGLPLSVLAERVVHRTHGLDPDTNLGRLGARLAAVIAGLPPPAAAADVCNAWKGSGSTGSSQVGGWQLLLHPSHPAAPVATAYQAAGEPTLLTIDIHAATNDPLFVPPPSKARSGWSKA
jgi:hypothetical protein